MCEFKKQTFYVKNFTKKGEFILQNDLLTIEEYIKDTFLYLDNCEAEKKHVKNRLELGIISSLRAANELDMIRSKEEQLKKELVEKCHVTKNGIPRRIVYDENRKLYQTKMPCGKRITATTVAGLYDKIMDYYHIVCKEYTIAYIFELAIREKELCDNNNPNTIVHLKTGFKYFFDEEIQQMNVQEITKVDIRAYTQKMVNLLHPKAKRFLEYKSLLNLIFNYALDKDIISKNPLAGFKNSVYLKSCDVSKATSEQKILSPEEIELIKKTVRDNMSQKRYSGYFINGYAILLSIETGMRVGEICSLKWSDIKEEHIWIHSQQLKNKNPKPDNGKGSNAEKTSTYYYADWTKDEKGISRGGRKFPLTNAIKVLLNELYNLQQEKQIYSEFIFCNADGEWIKSDAYETCLRRLCRSIGMPLTNNHAFRMSLNSNVFIGQHNFPSNVRAKLLGHSIQTNERFYSYSSKDTDLDDICSKLNNVGQVAPRWHQIIPFKAKEKSLESAKTQAFI